MAESSDVVRTFIAIPLPDFVKRFLSDIQSELKSAGWIAAWPDPEKKLYPMGLPAQPRPFFPHITLARIKKPVWPRGMISVIKRFERKSSHAFPVNRLVLYKSRLQPQGAVYKTLFQIALNH